MTKYRIEYYTFDNDKVVVKLTNIIDTIDGYARWMTLFDQCPSRYKYIRTIKIREDMKNEL